MVAPYEVSDVGLAVLALSGGARAENGLCWDDSSRAGEVVNEMPPGSTGIFLDS